MGVSFGLWFDVGLAANKLNGSYRRRDNGERTLCLGCEENAQMLFDGIRKQLAATNASLIKLDFAAFDCVSGAHTHAAGGVRSKRASGAESSFAASDAARGISAAARTCV